MQFFKLKLAFCHPAYLNVFFFLFFTATPCTVSYVVKLNERIVMMSWQYLA